MDPTIPLFGAHMTLPSVNTIIPPATTAAEVLDFAADRIEKYGWWQGDANKLNTEPYDNDAEQCTCLFLAVDYAPYGDPGVPWDQRAAAPNHIEIVREANAILFNLLGIEGEDEHSSRLDQGYHWNDAPGRTQAEVVGLLRVAADIARGGTEA